MQNFVTGYQKSLLFYSNLRTKRIEAYRFETPMTDSELPVPIVRFRTRSPLTRSGIGTKF